MMEFTNALSKYLAIADKNTSFLKEAIEDYIKLLAPLLHTSLKKCEYSKSSEDDSDYSVFNKNGLFDPSALIKDEVEIAVQVNGKIKNRIMIAADLSEEDIKTAAVEDPSIKAAIEGKTIIKVIVIKGRLVNIVVK